MGEFDAFTQAVAGSVKPPAPQSAPDLAKFTVLGGGADARLIAALCLSEGREVTLFSAYGAELEAMNASSGVTLRGAGPVGTYQFNRDAAPSIRTTAELDHAVARADVIFLTGPVHKQRTYAMVLADHLCDGQVLVLAPGRSLGALETMWFLRIGGCTADVTLVEAQNLPFWISAEGATLHLSDAGLTPASTLPSGRLDVLTALTQILPNLDPRDSVLASGFEDGSALVEIPAVLMGGPAVGYGSVALPMGATPLDENQTFASLIGSGHRRIIDDMVAERTAVAKAYGVRNLPDAQTLILRHAGTARGNGARAIPDENSATALVRDGVIGSLVPLFSAGTLAGVETPVTTAMITLASAVLGADVAAAGRRLDTIGINAGDIDAARRVMDAIATGRR